MSSDPVQTPNLGQSVGNRRLDSWKEIAAYLRRDERTVRRWEKDGLPVHRKVMNKKAAIFAYTEEIDAWWHSAVAEESAVKSSEMADPRLESGASLVVPPRNDPWNRHLALVAAGVIIAGLLAFIAFNRFGHDSASGPSRTALRSIAVLPLENISGDPAENYFAEGMTDALITDLAKISTLRVVSRTTMMQYRKQNKPLPVIGKELGVDAIVEGTVTRAGDRVRITAQLIRVATDEHLWAETYDRDLRDVLRLQKEVASAIAGEVHVQLTPAEQTQFSRTSAVDPQAYLAYLRGRYQWNRRSREGVSRGIEQFEEALARDPQYAPAYSGLADSYALLAEMGAPYREMYAEAKRNAKRALEIDPNLGDAHASLGMTFLLYDWNWEDADRELQIATKLDPNIVRAHQWYAVKLIAEGQEEMADSEVKSALQADPLALGANFHAGRIEYLSRKYDAATSHLEKTLEIDPSNVTSMAYLGLVYLEKGDTQKAIKMLERAKSLSDSLPAALGPLGCAYARANEKAKVAQTIRELQEAAGRGEIAAYYLATIYSTMGDTKSALFWLQKAYESRDPMMITRYRLDPLLDDVRGTEQFQALAKKIRP